MKNKLLFIAFLFTILPIFACGVASVKPGTGYEIKGNQVYYSRDGVTTALGQEDAVLTLIPAADASTFQILGQFDYAKDAKRVFFEGALLDKADPVTFKVLRLKPPYARDSQRVYFDISLISGAQIDSFEILGSTGVYARDSAQVYWSGKRVIGAQPKSFKVLYESDGNFYATDGIKVFGADRVFEGALPDSFEILVKPGANFVYSRDRQRVYINFTVIAGADPQTFKMLGNGEDVYSKDAKYVYESERVLAGADAATFELLSGQYFKDAQKVYWAGLTVEGADPATFKVKDGKGRDKNGCYNGFQKEDC